MGSRALTMSQRQRPFEISARFAQAAREAEQRREHHRAARLYRAALLALAGSDVDGADDEGAPAQDPRQSGTQIRVPTLRDRPANDYADDPDAAESLASAGATFRGRRH
jgi:hypothetical protein